MNQNCHVLAKKRATNHLKKLSQIRNGLLLRVWLDQTVKGLAWSIVQQINTAPGISFSGFPKSLPHIISRRKRDQHKEKRKRQ